MQLVFMAAGTKGSNFLHSLPSNFRKANVISRHVPGLQHDALSDIKSLCRKRDWDYIDWGEHATAAIESADLVILVGWRHLVAGDHRKFVVMHDSLLPRLRGFNPTVTALILGEKRHGVTAFRPECCADTGPVCGQEEISISYPTRIREVYEMLGEAYARLTVRIIDNLETGELSFVPQDASLATYSLWRDESDYFIDWNWPADQIARFVNAVSWPYLGAKTALEGRQIIVDRVTVLDDLCIPLRESGKVWSITNNVPTVVCGSGMISLLSARDCNGAPVEFKTLRSRLGRD